MTLNMELTPYRIPGEVLIQSQWRFNQAVLLSRLARFLGFPESPLDLEQVCRWMGLGGWQDRGTKRVNLSQVVGAKQGCQELDRAFRPKNAESLRSDWVTLAVVLQLGIRLPALDFYQWGEAYFVPDRLAGIVVSVLKAFVLHTIQARVLTPVDSKVPPPTLDYLEYWEREARKDHR